MRITLTIKTWIGGPNMDNNYVVLIRRLVYKTGLTILDLLIKIDASEKSIYKWMNGKSLPDCRHLLALLALANQSDESSVYRDH